MIPLGISHYLIGELIIGLGVAFIFITTGLHATQSSSSIQLYPTSVNNHISKRKNIWIQDLAD
jgi:hypothetical protein